MQLAAAALPLLATPGSAVRDWHSTLVSASGFSSQQFLQPAVSRADSSRSLSHILPQPRLQRTQKFASIRRSSSKVSYTALQRRHSLSIAQQLAALPLRHRSGGSAAHHHCTHARKHLFTRRLRPPPCPSISSSFFCSFLSQRSALPRAWPASFSLVCYLLSLFSPRPMGTVHCAWLRSPASATVVFAFSPSLLVSEMAGHKDRGKVGKQ